MKDLSSQRERAGVGNDSVIWADSIPFDQPDLRRRQLGKIVALIDDPKQAGRFRLNLVEQLSLLHDPDSAVERLSRFIEASRNQQDLLSVFDRDHASLGSILRLFATSQTVANRLISDPETFDLLRASDATVVPRLLLVEQLLGELGGVDHPKRATLAIRKFFSREIMRIAYQEFVHDLSPEKVGRALAQLNDVVVEAALQFSLARLAHRRGMPERPDGSVPEVTVIGLGNLGGQEMGYASPLKLIFLFDSIDHRNIWHRKFYETLVHDIVNLLCGDETRPDVIDIDLREGPQFEVGVPICSFREAAQIFETSGRAWQRMKFVKARVVAGSQTLGIAFLDRLKPWIYRQFTEGAEFAEIEAIRKKLSRRNENEAESNQEAPADLASNELDIVQTAGGRHSREAAVELLQIMHGGYLPTVRRNNLFDSVAALRHENCLTEQESKSLLENYARLCRLQHQLTVSFDRRRGSLPNDTAQRESLAWLLGIRDEQGKKPDVQKFEQLLNRTLAENRRLIGHLMEETRLERSQRQEPEIESELVLDPNPDQSTVQRVMRGHGLEMPDQAMENLAALSTETVPFLSPHRCRHAFASLAPSLLKEISLTPNPDSTLAMFVQVTDSLGAKAMLWDLLRSHHPTMQLMVRLCATTPYLTKILIDNPGMIDELVDSLLIDHLPSASRLDAHSIELCRGTVDINQVLLGFKSSAHLTIGVRDALGRATIESTHAAISDTAEACIRRVIDHELAAVAERFGDPIDEDGHPVEMVALALGKLGGREPNYHSDLDVVFLYERNGETRRRVGGHRSTISNHQFFNQVARRVLDRVNSPGPSGRLYDLNSRWKTPENDGVLAITVEEFLRSFHEDAAPLWQRLALCKARVMTGSLLKRTEMQEQVHRAIASTEWKASMADEIRQMRYRMEQTASMDNLKRGEGGAVDVELIAQMLTLKHSSKDPSIVQSGTVASLERLADAGILADGDAVDLIEGYRALRRIEANLRLMNTSDRHELPHDQPDLELLAFLIREPDSSKIRVDCDRVRKRNRELFNQVFDAASQA